MRQCPKCGKRFIADHVRVCDRDGSALEAVVIASARDRLVGAVVNDRYQIEGVLGDGGMGVVYRALGLADGGVYAIKVLRHEYSSDTDLVQRFQQEAQSAAAINHKNIVGVVEFGALPDESRYFVMEYLEGKSLGKLLADQGRVPNTNRRHPLPEWLAIHIALQICDGLGAAHQRAIVHRDLKPDNVHLIRRDGDEHFVKILDFGIAKVQNAQSARTRTGSVFGTPHYMSPEQAQGERDIDARTDVYALGVLMYEMLTGRVPFDADNMMGVLTAHLYHQPTPLRQTPEGARLSDGIEAIVLKALAKRRDARFQSMAEFREDLLRVTRQEVPRALEQADVVTSEIRVGRSGRHEAPSVVRPDEPLNEKRTVPSGRMTPPSAVPAHPPGDLEPVTVNSRPPVGMMLEGAPPEPMMVVPQATGRSIPPVTGSLGPQRPRVPLVAVVLSFVGIAAFSTAGLILLRRGEARTNPPAPIAVPASSGTVVAPVVPNGGGVPVGNPAPMPTPAQQAPQASDANSPTLTLQSDPPGAQVFLGRRRIGLTPLEVARPAAGRSETYSLAADGRLRVPVVVRHEMPRAIQVVLPERPGRAPGGAGASGTSGNANTGSGTQQPQRGGELIDPWANESRR